MTQRLRSGDVFETITGSTIKGTAHQLRHFVSGVLSRWRDGEIADTRRLLLEHPELQQYKTLVVDLAYEEYCQAEENGRAIDRETFCGRFPEWRTSICRRLEVHQYFAQNPELLGAPETSEWPELGPALRFELIDQLGQGAFARVYLATEPDLGGRPVVVKLSRHGGAEADLLGKLRHPNIVPIHSVQRDDDSGLTAVCMPYLGRATLTDVLDFAFTSSRNGNMSAPRRASAILQGIHRVSNPEEFPDTLPQPLRLLERGSYVDGVVLLAAQMAEALSCTHARKILHRDLKPSNVLLTPDGRPMLLDFNLSADTQTGARLVGGTLPYMSPEQIRSTFSPTDTEPAMDGRSDVFSLGVVVYELLCGELPFGIGTSGAASATEVWREALAARDRGAPSLRAKNPRVDRAIDELMMRCLECDPDRRPQALELARALRGQLNWSRRARRKAMIHPRLTAVAALLLVAAMATGGYALATREPYSVRELRQGRELYAGGQYAEALPHFDRAVKTDPSAAALFARGRTKALLGDHDAAYEDYRQAYELDPQPRTNACMGYCLSRREYFQKAIDFYERALKGGYESAGLYNNLGYCHSKRNELVQAMKDLDKAIFLNPDLKEAYYNRATVGMQQAIAARGNVSPRAHQDIDRAIGDYPSAADLHYLAAQLWDLSAPAPDSAAQMTDHLEKALELGLDPRRLKTPGAFRSVADDERFRELQRRPQRTIVAQASSQLVDPVDVLDLP